jgi:electron transport protein HydN
MSAVHPVLDPARCTPCGVCEEACVTHRYGPVAEDVVLERRRLAIRVVAGVPAMDVCVNCPDSPCVSACPHHALVRFPGGRVDLVEARCTGCGACIAACPYRAIRRVTALDIAVKCDACAGVDGLPACVPACPDGALALVDAGAANR